MQMRLDLSHSSRSTDRSQYKVRGTMSDEEEQTSNLLPRRIVIYCEACGMPPEYCEYGPDFEAVCDPWLKKNHPELRKELMQKRGDASKADGGSNKAEKPDHPWTLEERLTAFYNEYVPEKVSSIPSLLEKYAGKEEKLFEALVKKYGPEPLDPYYSESEDEDDVALSAVSKSKRRGLKAKTTEAFQGRVVIQRQSQKKKRFLTVIKNLEPALAHTPHKLKDASKTFSKRFAGSSSVKNGQVILQGDHVLEVAEMIVDKFQVPEECVYLDMDGKGSEVPFSG